MTPLPPVFYDEGCILLQKENAGSSDANRKTLDYNIKKLEDAARALKGYRYWISPIASLPPEVLTEIFGYAQLGPDFFCMPPLWNNFSQVCQHWRAVALHTPKLWSTFALSSRPWTLEKQQRSKGTSLIVTVSEVANLNDPSDFLTTNCSRIDTLVLRTTRQSQSLLSEKLPDPGHFHKLRRLEISGTFESWRHIKGLVQLTRCATLEHLVLPPGLAQSVLSVINNSLQSPRTSLPSEGEARKPDWHSEFTTFASIPRA